MPTDQRAPNLPPDMPALLATLAARLGADAVVTDPATCALHSQDVFRRAEPVAAVLRPADADGVAVAVRLCAEAGVAVVPRGGGMSYTDGYLPVRSPSVCLDTGRLSRIVAIDADAMTVTVEAGVTWAALRDALRPLGLRTPYWGPMSGIRATVGGAISQGSIFFGSARYGAAADSVLSLSVVLGDGTLLETGSLSSRHGTAFFRHHGPDLTGLFTGDCGALGVKVRATLRLLKESPAQAYLSFGFDDYPAMAAALAAIAREGLCSEIAAFDPYLASLRMRRASLMSDVGALGSVVRGAGSLLKGVKEAARVAVAGRRFMEGVEYSIHCTLDGLTEAALEPAVALVRGHALKTGREIESTIARMMRAIPFPPPNSMLGPDGERWVPVHGIVPLTAMEAAMAACERVFAEEEALCRDHGIEHGYLMTIVATHGFLIEPCLYWPDAAQEIHAAFMEPDYLTKVGGRPARPDNHDAVARLKARLADALAAVGATHFQLGKFYPYRPNLKPAAAGLLDRIKAAVDPHDILNPGALGLGGG